MSDVDVFEIGLDQIHDLQVKNHGCICDFDATNTEVIWGSWLLVSCSSTFGKPAHFVFVRDCCSRSDAVELARMSEVACDPINSPLNRGYHFEVWHVVDDSEVEWMPRLVEPVPDCGKYDVSFTDDAGSYGGMTFADLATAVAFVHMAGEFGFRASMHYKLHVSEPSSHLDQLRRAAYC